MNYYELLQVTPSASVEVIKNAYKAMAKKYHPDLYQGNRAFAEEKMKLLNEAISVLESDEKRREYNIENNFPDMSYGANQNDGFMKDIDDFLNYSDSAVNMPADITDITTFDNPETDALSDADDPYEKRSLFDYEEELEKARAKGKKNKTKIGSWYYIVIAGLIIANVTVVCLIIATFSTTLLNSFLKKDTSEVEGELSDEDYDNMEDYIEPEDWNDDWDDGIITENEIAEMETTQDFVETSPVASETTTEKAALTLPPTATTTGKKLPSTTTASKPPVTTAKPAETETEAETISEYTETEVESEPIEFPSEEELPVETYDREEDPEMNPQESTDGNVETDAEDNAETDSTDNEF